MSQTISEFLAATIPAKYKHRPRVVCADGFNMSVQASRFNYCEPRVDGADSYESVEIGFPSHEDPLIAHYAEDKDNLTGTVYGWVPISVIDEVITKHGGFAKAEGKEAPCTQQ